MKNIFLIISFLLVLNVSLAGQNYKPVTVKAGRSVLEYFPLKERYRYADFTPGKVIFKSGIYSETKLNYNILMGEMEFIKSTDTLSVVNKKDILLIAITSDTFFYDNAYFELLAGGSVKVVLKQFIKLKEILKKDSYGVSSSGSSRESYNSLPSESNFYKLKANDDLVFQRTLEYYLVTPSNEFVQFTRKNVLKLYPLKEDMIKSYLKSNKVDFNSREDLLRLADNLKSL
jgi:hypothetical protein